MADGASRNRPARGAMVLVLVLIVVMMIALAGFSFAELMLTENKATHLHGDELRLEQAIGSGVELLKLFGEQSSAKQLEAGGAFNNPTLFRGIPLIPDDRSLRVPTHQVRFSIVAPLLEEEQAGGIRFGVENESGRLHLADLLRWDQQQPGSGRKALMNFSNMTEAIADAILDWMDSDAQPRALGAETDYYLGLERPYAPRNGLPECLEELLLVKGVTRELLFGSDANYNHQIDPEELVESRSNARSTSPTTAPVPWASLLTIYSGQRNLTSEGRPRIDLNGMDLMKLQTQLTEALDANWAAFIVAYRQYGPSASVDAAAPGPPLVLAPTSPHYAIRSVLDLAGANVAIPSPLPSQPPKVYASPLPVDPQGVAQQLSNLLDKTTVVPVPVIRGGVSVNHASSNVLRGVPGIDDALADRIVTARDARASQEDAGRRFPTWLLTEGVVNLPTMKTLLPNVCAGGEVVRAQVVGHFDPPGPAARAEVVVDATTLPARQIFWRDLRFWGPGYPLEWLGEEGDHERSMKQRMR